MACLLRETDVTRPSDGELPGLRAVRVRGGTPAGFASEKHLIPRIDLREE